MSVKFGSIKVQMEFTEGVWTDVSADIISDIRVRAGIAGNGPLDKVASTGVMQFTLQNVDNQYTPTHSACVAGFEKGTPCRLVVEYERRGYTKFYGRIEALALKRGIGLMYYTDVAVADYMNIIASHELHLLTFAQGKKHEEVIALILANMDIQPGSTSYGTGQDTFSAVFDTTKSNQRAMQEVAKVTGSELGSVYVTPSHAWSGFLLEDGSGKILLESGDQMGLESPDEILTTRGRYSHSLVTSSASFTDEDLSSISVSYGENYYNDVKTVVYPREIDAAATSILFSLDGYVAISAGETITITGRYVDPNQKAQTIAGISMVTPAATTDYLFNTASDGTGTNITANLTVMATYGTNGVEYTLTNNSAGTGYVTFLQARGKGVYTYQPVEYSQVYQTGISSDGRRTLNLEMPYHDNALVGSDFASMLLDIYKTKSIKIESISYDANKSSTLAGYFRDLHIGSRITLDITDLDIGGDYFINEINYVINTRGAVGVSYLLISDALLPAGDYWKLDDASYSQLGQTTKLGF